KYPDRQRPSQFAFEHSHHFFLQTQKQLLSNGPDSTVRLHFAPLKPWSDEDGKEYNYYDSGVVSNALKGGWDRRIENVLVLVDGPPGNTGEMARYPALPMISQALPDANVHYLMDDYVREDEKRIVQRWSKWLQSRGLSFSIDEL